MLFSLKFQRNNQQSALTVDPAKRKTGEKDCIFTGCGDETTPDYDSANEIQRLCYKMVDTFSLEITKR